jgi:hypothetical protein
METREAAITLILRKLLTRLDDIERLLAPVAEPEAPAAEPWRRTVH